MASCLGEYLRNGGLFFIFLDFAVGAGCSGIWKDRRFHRLQHKPNKLCLCLIASLMLPSSLTGALTPSLLNLQCALCFFSLTKAPVGGAKTQTCCSTDATFFFWRFSFYSKKTRSPESGVGLEPECFLTCKNGFHWINICKIMRLKKKKEVPFNYASF